MHGMWIIRWYIKRVCCFCFWEEGKQTVQFARLNIPTFVPHGTHKSWNYQERLWVFKPKFLSVILHSDL